MEYPLQLQSLSQLLANGMLRLNTWKLDVNLPPYEKYVLVGAPHTSNTDFLYMLLLMYSTGLKLHWIGKDSIFRSPLGNLFRRLGGIPVDRRSRNNVVSQIVDEFQRQDQFILLIAPEGTRRKADCWKTGFYYIAQGAGVPIVLAFIDYRRKVVGIGPSIHPTGDIQADFKHIQHFYSDKTGKHPARQGQIRLSLPPG